MRLTKLQRRAVLRAKELSDKPFPVGGSMLRYWKSYLLVCALAGGYAWWTWSIDFRAASFGGLGFLLGFLVRDIAWLRLTARMWPVTVEVTNWSKVDELLNEPAQG